jgi:hypothetical protein
MLRAYYFVAQKHLINLALVLDKHGMYFGMEDAHNGYPRVTFTYNYGISITAEHADIGWVYRLHFFSRYQSVILALSKLTHKLNPDVDEWIISWDFNLLKKKRLLKVLKMVFQVEEMMKEC